MQLSTRKYEYNTTLYAAIYESSKADKSYSLV